MSDSEENFDLENEVHEEETVPKNTDNIGQHWFELVRFF